MTSYHATVRQTGGETTGAKHAFESEFCGDVTKTGNGEQENENGKLKMGGEKWEDSGVSGNYQNPFFFLI